MRNIENLSLWLQVLSLELLLKDYNNSDLMQELQNQDTNYLQKIISQNEEILELIKERSNSYDRENIENNW